MQLWKLKKWEADLKEEYKKCVEQMAALLSTGPFKVTNLKETTSP